MFSEIKWFYIAFSSLLLLTLWQVWQPTYFVTGDGACHLHNAMVWKEMVLYKKSFYQGFYELNQHISPNYAGHILLAFLCSFFSPPVAEKILITFYILLLCNGWLQLSKQLNAQTHGFLLFIFPFIFQVFLFLGFYNYLLGIAGFVFLFAHYLKYKKGVTSMPILLIFSLGSLLLYFVHVVGFALFMLALAFDFLFEKGLSFFNSEKRKETLRHAFTILLIGLPGLCCLFLFSQSQVETNTVFSTPFNQLFYDLLNWNSLMVFSKNEKTYLHFLFVILYASFFLVSFLSLLKKKYSHGQHLIASLLLFTSTMYFLYPDVALGGEMIKLRFQTLIFLFLILLLALHHIPRWMNYFLLGSVFLFSGFMIYSKQKNILRMSEVVSDIKNVEPFIENNSFILPLSFHTSGVWDGREISKEVHFSTNHVSEYLHDGKKKLVFADNYEANTNYFPLMWKPEVNPSPFLPMAESQPPEIDLGSFKSACELNYVLIFNLLPSDHNGEALNNMLLQLTNHFHKVAETGSCILFQRNTKGLSE